MSWPSGYEVVPVRVHDLTQSALDVEDDRCVRFSTAAAFKGLGSEAIIYADIDDLSSRSSTRTPHDEGELAQIVVLISTAENVPCLGSSFAKSVSTTFG